MSDHYFYFIYNFYIILHLLLHNNKSIFTFEIPKISPSYLMIMNKLLLKYILNFKLDPEFSTCLKMKFSIPLWICRICSYFISSIYMSQSFLTNYISLLLPVSVFSIVILALSVSVIPSSPHPSMYQCHRLRCVLLCDSQEISLDCVTSSSL